MPGSSTEAQQKEAEGRDIDIFEAAITSAGVKRLSGRFVRNFLTTEARHDEERTRTGLLLSLKSSGADSSVLTVGVPQDCDGNVVRTLGMACRCVGGAKSHPLQKRQRMGHPRNGEFEKKRDKVGRLSSRHEGAGSEEGSPRVLCGPF